MLTIKSKSASIKKENQPDNWIIQVKKDPNRSLQNIYLEHRIGCINWVSSKFQLMPEDARDIFQSAVVVMYENVIADKITNKQANLRSYLIGICNNLTLAWLRREKKYTSSLPMPVLVDYMYSEIENEDQRAEKFKLCTRCMESLGSPCKEILTHFYFEGRSMQEIMDMMGYKNVQTVKSQKYKCMQRLKKMMLT